MANGAVDHLHLAEVGQVQVHLGVAGNGGVVGDQVGRVHQDAPHVAPHKRVTELHVGLGLDDHALPEVVLDVAIHDEGCGGVRHVDTDPVVVVNVGIGNGDAHSVDEDPAEVVGELHALYHGVDRVDVQPRLDAKDIEMPTAIADKGVGHR